MARSFEKFPVRHIDGNLTFGNDGTVWAYFLLKGYNYDLRDDNGKLAPFLSQMGFFKQNVRDLHMVVQPIPTDTDQIIDETIEEIKRKSYPLQQQGIAYMQKVKEALKNSNFKNDSTQYHSILGVQLRRNFNLVKEVNTGNSMLQTFMEFLRGIRSPLYRAVGLEPFDILQKEIDVYHKEAQDVRNELKKSFKCDVQHLTVKQMVYFMEQNYSVEKQEIHFRDGFTTSDEVEGIDPEGKTHKGKRPKPKTFFNLQDCEIQEVDRRTLLMQRLVDNEIEENYVRYLVCDDISATPEHPGFEWLYDMQNKLDFPVTFSIRAHHVTNEKTLALLSDAMLALDDQKTEAAKVGESAGDSVLDTERGAIKMQTVFKKNGWCSYNTSFLFKITAKDKETLDSRTKDLVSEMSRYSMSLITPFGEQLNFFHESILGSGKRTTEYQNRLSAHVLAGLMFSATNEIGDNRGFYFGQTVKQNRPVFLQMDLAAKNYKHIKNLYDSISIMVAGMTGKGKSMLMNLLVYLSVLMGSLALVVDPKGDKHWQNGLPFIPKEFISVWTLGESEKDNGCLDPFRITENADEARDLAVEIVSHMSNIKIGDLTFTLLSDIVDAVIKEDDPCMGSVLTHVTKLESELYGNNQHDPRAGSIVQLAGTLRSIRSHKLGRLLFSEVNQPVRPLQVDKPLQVLMVQNLQLPEDGKPATTPAGKFSEMIMLSLTAFTKEYMIKQDRYRHKIILQDEAAAIERSATGGVLLNFVTVKGRYFNTSLVKGTQNPTSFGNDSNNIGMKFTFGLPNETEAKQMLNFMNLPLTEENITMLQTLDKGYALYQDIFGRCAVLYVNPVFSEVFDAFDTSTSTKEEKELEEQKHREKVGASG